MIKAKSVSLRRKSFGGQTGVGIWWRKRSSPTSARSKDDDDETDNTFQKNKELSASPTSEDSPCKAAKKTKKNNGPPTTPETPPFFLATRKEPIIGWDDDLCRPIYHRDAKCDHRESVPPVSFVDSGLVVETSDSGTYASDEDGQEICDKAGGCLDNAKGESRADSGSSTVFPSSLANQEPSSKACQAGGRDVIPVPTRKRTRTFGNRSNRRRPLSLILTQDNEEEAFGEGSRRVSLEPSEDALPATGEEEKASEPEQQPKAKERRSKRLRSSKNPSLENAREYFANLDKTQPLTLDSALSPQVSSRVTRTRRRTNLASPGMQRKYRAYAESISGDGHSGISPLSIRDFASSRKLHFENKGEIVDGFLDD